MARRQREPAEPPDGPPSDPVGLAREITLRLLTDRARSRRQLEEVLAHRHVPPDAAREVLDRFTELGLIDDAGYARAWLESRRRRLRPTAVARRELKGLGVDDELIEEAVAEVPEEADEEAALAVARKRTRTVANLSDPAAYRRVMGALARRGFSAGVASRAVRDAFAEAEQERTG